MKFQLIVLINFIFSISTLVAESIKAQSNYCTQYNSTELYFDKSKIDNLTKEQYLLENFEAQIGAGSRLDYYIKYFHIAAGFCYYDDERVKQSLDSFSDIEGIDNNTNSTVTYDYVRYAKTINCYYMYKQYLAEDDDRNYEILNMSDGSQQRVSKLKIPCSRYIAEYNNIMVYFLLNSENKYCPLPTNSDMVSLGDEDEIIEARKKFLVELINTYESEEAQNAQCYDKGGEKNEEIVNCGFDSQKKKLEYCNKYNDECCGYRDYIESSALIQYKPATIAMVIGSSTSVAFLILGLFFSYGSIKDIKTKEKIEEAVYRQEKMYSNKQQSRRDSGSSSGNQNSLHPPSQYNHSLPKSHVSENRPIRSPQPLPASPANYSNYNSNASLLGGNSNVGGSSNSVNLRPRGSSLYSQSSADISSDISVPIDVPVSPYLDRPTLTLPKTERSSSLVDYSPNQPVERPPRATPISDYPQAQSLQSPRSPYLQPGNNSASRPGTPNAQSSMYYNPQLQGSRPTTPSIPPRRDRRPSSIIERPPRTPELERPTTPKLELPQSSPFLI